MACAGFFPDQTVLPVLAGGRQTVLQKESKRRGKSVELVLNCKATLVQMHQSIWASNQLGLGFMRTFLLGTKQDIFLLYIRYINMYTHT